VRSWAGVALVLAFAAGCGASERHRAEAAVREHEDRAAGRIAEVRCARAELMWGCTVRLEDGRTQACQVAVDPDGDPTGVGCQPIQAE